MFRAVFCSEVSKVVATGMLHEWSLSVIPCDVMPVPGWLWVVGRQRRRSYPRILHHQWIDQPLNMVGTLIRDIPVMLMKAGE